jgi:hypothetical protein
LSGNRDVKTVAAAAEAHECPEGYDGWLGKPKVKVISGSPCDGRIVQ